MAKAAEKTTTRNKKATGAPAHSLREIRLGECELLQRNPQYLTPRQMEALKASIERDGFVAPILVRSTERGYEIVSGNHRFLAAQELGYETIPAVIADLTKAAAERLAVNLNLIHGDPTAEQLAPFLADLDDDVLSEIYLDGQLKADVLAFDELLNERLKELKDVPGFDQESSKNRPDCKCPTCGRLHQSAS